MSKLFIVATPIGNLNDITLRALEVLRSADVVLAEDTRMAKKLLSHFDVQKAVMSYHKFSGKGAEEKVLELLEEGKNIALVTDAGTPGISDPGYWLVKKAAAAGFAVVPVPGASSLSAIISVSDIDLSRFSFLGFPPHKKGRQTFFREVAASSIPVVIFESPHRILKTLKELESVAGDRYVNIGRELTKIYEEIFRGKISEAITHFTGEKERGEFVIVLDPTNYK
ncbi:16S rRNA (cytidine(1402)-2'-O)-methyltransferase [Candidatus Giovannonibacteria bacterium]|nr:16S rRNA (cytidine(1402)-2'-O)-methyltransferase [Candidatus Giovannonibacteria bacterium]